MPQRSQPVPGPGGLRPEQPLSLATPQCSDPAPGLGPPAPRHRQLAGVRVSFGPSACTVSQEPTGDAPRVREQLGWGGGGAGFHDRRRRAAGLPAGESSAAQNETRIVAFPVEEKLPPPAAGSGPPCPPGCCGAGGVSPGIPPSLPTFLRRLGRHSGGIGDSSGGLPGGGCCAQEPLPGLGEVSVPSAPLTPTCPGGGRHCRAPGVCVWSPVPGHPGWPWRGRGWGGQWAGLREDEPCREHQEQSATPLRAGWRAQAGAGHALPEPLSPSAGRDGGPEVDVSAAWPRGGATAWTVSPLWSSQPVAVGPAPGRRTPLWAEAGVLTASRAGWSRQAPRCSPLPPERPSFVSSPLRASGPSLGVPAGMGIDCCPPPHPGPCHDTGQEAWPGRPTACRGGQGRGGPVAGGWEPALGVLWVPSASSWEAPRACLHAAAPCPPLGAPIWSRLLCGARAGPLPPCSPDFPVLAGPGHPRLGAADEGLARQ